MRGPHDDVFYHTLQALTDEYTTAQRLGYWPGAGFLTPGTRLGGRSVPSNAWERRQLAATAAVRRQGQTAGGTRLGGAASSRPLNQLAAEAALRRQRDARTCASQQDMQEILNSTREADVVALDDSDEDTPSGVARGTCDDPILIE